MFANYWPHLLAIAVGAGLTVQIGMNSTLGRAFDSPLWATVANFVVGLLALLACAFALGVRPLAGGWQHAPGWAWFGGLLGASYVAAVTLVGPRIGAVAVIGFTLAGQLCTALLVDHFGALGFARAEVTPTRLVGAALLVAGALLVMRR